MMNEGYGASSMDFPTLTEAATTIMTPEELKKLRCSLSNEKIEHAKYIRAHPEIDIVMRGAMRKLLMERPSDPVAVLLEFFAYGDLSSVLHPTEDEAVKLRRAALAQHGRGLMRKWPP